MKNTQTNPESNGAQQSVNAQSNDNMVILESLATSLCFAVSDKNPESMNTQSNAGTTLLHIAIEQKNTEIIELLLKYGTVETVNAKDNEGWTPLHIAMQQGNAELVAALLAKGAEITLYADSNNINTTPLHMAAHCHFDWGDSQNNIMKGHGNFKACLDVVERCFKERPGVFPDDLKCSAESYFNACAQKHAMDFQPVNSNNGIQLINPNVIQPQQQPDVSIAQGGDFRSLVVNQNPKKRLFSATDIDVNGKNENSPKRFKTGSREGGGPTL